MRAPDADFYYCVRDRESDPFVARLETLCAQLPSLRLKVISSARQQRLSAAMLDDRARKEAVTEVWFCGPRGLADSLRKGLHEMGVSRFRFHQEAFEMR